MKKWDDVYDVIFYQKLCFLSKLHMFFWIKILLLYMLFFISDILIFEVATLEIKFALAGIKMFSGNNNFQISHKCEQKYYIWTTAMINEHIGQIRSQNSYFFMLFDFMVYNNISVIDIYSSTSTVVEREFDFSI